MRLTTVAFPCEGGLNLSASEHSLLKRAGEAIELVNFEPSKRGGYRRISGYTQFGTLAVPGTGRIKGITNYQEGVVVCRGDDIYHSFDGTYWVQVNKVVTQANEATLSAVSATPRSSLVENYVFQERTQDNQHVMYICDGVGNPMLLMVEGTNRAGASYTYREITSGADLIGVGISEMHKDQFIIAGPTNNPSTLFYSAFTDPLVGPANGQPQENFGSAQAGSISVKDPIVGLKAFRSDLYVFCMRSIHKVTGLETGAPTVEPITQDIGCIDGNTIQEIGGDLIFLGPDGLRSLAATQRNNDLELGTVSRKISPLIDRMLRNKSSYMFRSAVVRNKNQYRLWYTSPGMSSGIQRGIIACYTFNPETNGYGWQFAEMKGMEVTSVDSGYDSQKAERIVHGDLSGGVYVQETGINFNGTKIPYVLKTAFTDFGDVGVRKNIHRVLMETKVEGTVEIGLDVRYDHERPDVHQPAIFALDRIFSAATFGDPDTIFGDPSVVFGARMDPDTYVYTEGSGFNVSYRVTSLNTGDDAPFEIRSFTTDLTPSGRI